MIGLVFAQKFWPGAGDVDDCWVIAALKAVFSVAPWEYPHVVSTFRNAASNPDDPTKPDGGTVAQAFTAIQKLYPKIAALTTYIKGGTFDQLQKGVEAGRVADVHLASGKLPTALRFGWAGGHAVTLAFEGGKLLFANPLAKPHSKPIVTTWAAIKPAIIGYDGGKVWALLMPTAGAAFKTHPWLAGEIKAAVDKATAVALSQQTPAELVATAKAQGFADGFTAAKTAAGAAVAGIKAS